MVGGGNSAGQAAVHLAKFASRVTILVRGESLAQSMSEYLITEIDATRPSASRRPSVKVPCAYGSYTSTSPFNEITDMRDPQLAVTCHVIRDASGACPQFRVQE